MMGAAPVEGERRLQKCALARVKSRAGSFFRKDCEVETGDTTVHRLLESLSVVRV